MLTDWYYSNGDGMLLDRTSRSVYLQAKDNLIRSVAGVVPTVAARRIAALDPQQHDEAHGRLAQRQLSLLRTQLKTDLAIFGTPYGPSLDDEDRKFLKCCGVDLNRKPWKQRRTPSDTAAPMA
jgi:hypothetical protein